MSLLQTIKQDQLQTRKDKVKQPGLFDDMRISLLTTLYSEAANVGLNDNKRESTDVEVVAVVKKFLKGVDETLEANAENVVALYEKSVLEDFLPTQFSEVDLRLIVGDIIMEVEAGTIKDMGRVMKTLKDRYDGQYDGKTASNLVRQGLTP